GAKIQAQPGYQNLIREYLSLRARTANSAEAQVRLAAWCSQRGLKEQAQAHYISATRLDPSRDIAWRRLGYKKDGNRWVRHEQAAADKMERERQKRAGLYWKPRLEKLRDGMLSAQEARREKAQRELSCISDPRAVPTIASVLASGGARSQLVAVQVL